MQDPTARIIAILKQYARDLGYPVAGWTRFSELGIDRLDLPLIVLDIEDAFAIQGRLERGAEERKRGRLVCRCALTQAMRSPTLVKPSISSS